MSLACGRVRVGYLPSLFQSPSNEQVMNISKQFNKQLAAELPTVLCAVLTDNTTVGALREMIASDPRIAGLSLGALVKSKPRKQSVAKPTSTPKASKVNARTAEGRAKLDVAVLDSITKLGGSDIAASSIKVGADPNQRRASLDRLIEAELVTWSGRARGTRYHLAA